VNLGHMQKHGPIYILDEGIEKLKPHQIEGVRFLWQTLVQTGLNKGALLAHTMGLGKTRQVITFLYTLAVAGGSADKKIYEQIPKDLRKSKTLILSPAGLVENWMEEFSKWLPVDTDSGKLREDYIGQIYRADGVLPPLQRMTAIKEWHAAGGVLLMGFQTFERYINRAPTSQVSARDQERLREILLVGPNVIVADEAHHLKNSQCALAKAAAQFKSKSRIAMTGSPLSNNLEEYWAMIEWIDPRYLGPLTEFKRKYMDPITDGLYSDSNPAERRRSMTMLKVLQKDLSLKVHRAGIDVIQSDMPQKTEFMVTVPLTKLQKEIYTRFVYSMLETDCR
jgi:SNF2 family DNA or RNA helicase